MHPQRRNFTAFSPNRVDAGGGGGRGMQEGTPLNVSASQGPSNALSRLLRLPQRALGSAPSRATSGADDSLPSRLSGAPCSGASRGHCCPLSSVLWMWKINCFLMTDGSGVENKSKKRIMALVILTFFFPLGDMSYINQKEARFCHKYIFPKYSHSGSVEWSKPGLAGLVYTQSRMRKRALSWRPPQSPCRLSVSLPG